MSNQISTGALVLIAAVGGLGALLGAVITSILNIFGENRKDRREHQQWLRERQFDEFTALMVASAHVHMASTPGLPQDKFREALREWEDAAERAILIIPPPDSETLREYTRDFHSEILKTPKDGAKTAALGKSMRQLLHPHLTNPKHKMKKTKRRTQNATQGSSSSN